MSTSQMEQRLWEYIDGLSSEEERAAISRLLHTDHSWKAKYEELVALSEMLTDIELEQPSLRFTQNVMEEISRAHITPAASSYINKKLVYGLAGFFITMIIGLIIYFIAQVSQAPGTDSSPVAFDVSNVQWAELINNSYMNVFLFINLLAAFMLLDRYLSNKKESLRQKNYK